MPFHLRWFMPKLLGSNLNYWRIASIVGWVMLVFAVGIMGGWPAALLVAVLPGTTLGFKLPVLVDGVALGVAGLAAIHQPIATQILLAIIAGCVSERAPVFAALWSWSPWPLVGLIVPAIRYLTSKPGPELSVLIGTYAGDALIKPWRIGLQRNWHEPWLITPWGGLLAALLYMDIHMALTLLVAYAQLFVATDNARLAQWSAPVLAIALARNLDWKICIVLALVTWFNPWRGDGI